MAPPRNSPLPDMTPKVVAVPKSIKMQGPPYSSHAATALAMRSEPSSRGLSYFRLMPVFTPGTTSGGMLARTRLLLVVFPHDLGWDPNVGFDGRACLPVSWYAENPGLPGAADLLRERAAAFRRAAIGRDADFRLLCSLYADALETAADRGWFYASAYWLAAEDLRAELEARVAAGETLGAKQ